MLTLQLGNRNCSNGCFYISNYLSMQIKTCEKLTGVIFFWITTKKTKKIIWRWNEWLELSFVAWWQEIFVVFVKYAHQLWWHVEWFFDAAVITLNVFQETQENRVDCHRINMEECAGNDERTDDRDYNRVTPEIWLCSVFWQKRIRKSARCRCNCHTENAKLQICHTCCHINAGQIPHQ